MKEYSFQNAKLVVGGLEITRPLEESAEGELDKLKGHRGIPISLDFSGLELRVLALHIEDKLLAGLFQALRVADVKHKMLTVGEIMNREHVWNKPFNPSVINTDVTGSHEPWKRNNRLVGKRSRKSK